MKKLLLILVLAVMGGNVATAGDFDAAAKAYQKRDYVTAITLFFSLADKGHATAQFNLGVMHENGTGVVQDFKKSVGWYRMAAEQGYVKAQFNLALMYEGGKWVKQDYILAHMWYNLAAKNGDKFGTLSRDIVADQMTPAQISEAQKLAKECEKKNYKNCD
ncbi:MAG: sel1 repeat family protein [Nitrosomonadaceae bacterium]|nr:sel1 repeat family protein [Nitrosomonadaceae bacterium]